MVTRQSSCSSSEAVRPWQVTDGQSLLSGLKSPREDYMSEQHREYHTKPGKRRRQPFVAVILSYLHKLVVIWLIGFVPHFLTSHILSV
jgi:hypothetical protein